MPIWVALPDKTPLAMEYSHPIIVKGLISHYIMKQKINKFRSN